MVEVALANQDDIEKWDSYVDRSPQGNAFHYTESLATIASHSRTELHRLIGYKGQEVVGLFPVFEYRVLGQGALFSPPPNLLIPYQGPALLNIGKLKQRKAERRHGRFLRGCFEWCFEELAPRYASLRTDGRYDDLRPIKWSGFDVTPEYTYTVDLTVGEEALLAGFSSDARGNVRDGEDVEYTVEEGGEEAIDRIITQMIERHAAQDLFYGATPEFVTDLYRSLPEGTVRPYTIAVDGEFVGGMVTLEDGNTIYRWQGGAKHDRSVPANDLLDWEIMTDATDRGLETYDLVGASNPRLNGYKAKFGPDLRTFHSAERTGPITSLAAEAYKRLR
jgi:hypothetical protein